ncbi:MAG: nuclear transport factor 2 family protein [bacterium]
MLLCGWNATTGALHRFTDLFTLLKVDGEWKIINKCSIFIPKTRKRKEP